jgi:hypothetical protein
MWKDIEHELPDEEMTVLVYLDCGLIGLGRWFEEEGDIQLAPWEGGLCDEEAVVR